ncbi:MAG: ArsR/SmtB family transcription factor [Anaeroplasmataceae bacterium]
MESNNLVEMVKSKIPSDNEICDLSELFKVFGDSTRTKILSCLEISELCVCDISLCLNMSVSAVSHQLRILRNAHLVKTKKVGKEVYYSLDDEHVVKIIECGLSHINE